MLLPLTNIFGGGGALIKIGRCCSSASGVSLSFDLKAKKILGQKELGGSLTVQDFGSSRFTHSTHIAHIVG